MRSPIAASSSHPRTSMTEREAALMAQYGIVAETKTVYRYGPY